MKRRLFIFSLLFVVSVMSFLLAKSFLVAAATSDSLRVCSSLERSRHASNNLGDTWAVASDSMSPLLTSGDVVAVEKGVAFEDLGIDEIIVFKEPIPITEKESAIISRINEILLYPNEDRVLITKGDANSASIPGVDFPIYKNNFVGRVSCILEEGQMKR